MNFHQYTAFLSVQDNLVHKNEEIKMAINATKQLYDYAKQTDAELPLFPLLDTELSQEVNQCSHNFDNIQHLLSSFRPADLISLSKELKQLATVKTNAANLNISAFVAHTYSTTTIDTLQDSLYMVADRKKSITLYDGTLANKLADLDAAIKSSSAWGFVSPTTAHKNEASDIQAAATKNLNSDEIIRIIRRIEDLISNIHADLTARGSKFLKNMGIGLGITLLVVFVLMNLTAIINLVVGIVVGIAYIIGGIIVIWIVLAVISNSNRY